MAYKTSNANGQATMANSEPVVIASNQSSIPVAGDVAAAAGGTVVKDMIGGGFIPFAR